MSQAIITSPPDILLTNYVMLELILTRTDEINLVAAAVLAPVWEEVFFRGFATTAWERTAGARAAIAKGGGDQAR